MEPVKLKSRQFTEKTGLPGLVILHGMLGSSRNWSSMGKALSEDWDVYALDLRNHGESPHANAMDYPLMAEDVKFWMDENELSSAVLIGHSMGGKVAMRFACDYPERCRGLVVVDIAPREYPPRWEREFAVMRRLPVAEFKSRGDAEKALEPEISDWAFRKFLCTNLARNPNGPGYHWSINLETIQAALPELFLQVPEQRETYDGPCRFVLGEKSSFVKIEEDDTGIKAHFPAADIVTVPEAGHNVHFDNPSGFLEVMKTFKDRIE